MRCLLPLLAVIAAADGLSETERLSAAIAELDASPAGAAYRALGLRIEALSSSVAQQIKTLRAEQGQLAAGAAFREYIHRRDELQARRLTGWDAERKAMEDEAQRIYAARHGELRSRAPAAVPQGAALAFDALSYPRLDGSTSTSPLGVVLACRLLDVPYAWQYPPPRGQPWRQRNDLQRFSTVFSPYGQEETELELAAMRVAAEPTGPRNQRLAPLINSVLAKHSSTHDGWVALIEGRCDLNLTARLPSASELQLARDKGLTLRHEPIARDAFVMLVHVANPVRGLTREQVRGIYEERFTFWDQVGGGGGGGDGRIHAYRRQRDSGSRELFDELVLQGAPSPDQERHSDLYGSLMGHPFSQLTMDRGGIAYSIHYYERFMAASPYTRSLAIDGVEPTAESIASGAYPWSTRVYAAWREGEPELAPAMRLLRWLRSPEGQAVVAESGYIPER